MEVTVIACLAGLGEEMLFRGVLQGLASGGFGSWVSIGLVNVLFGLLHMVTPMYAFAAGLSGVHLLLSLVWEQSTLVGTIPPRLLVRTARPTLTLDPLR